MTEAWVCASAGRIETIADRLIGEAAREGRIDLINGFAAPYPSIVFAALLGVPEEDHAQLKIWSADYAEMLGNFQHNIDRIARVLKSTGEMIEYFRRAIHEVDRPLADGLLKSLVEAEVDYEQLRDPYGIAFWPNFKGRDGCRTPLPWNDDANAGFSSGTPWLPVAKPHRALAVSAQESDPHSTLNAARAFLRWRKAHPALVQGAIRFLDAPEPVLAFVRELPGQRLLLAFNLSDAPVAWDAPGGYAEAMAVPGMAPPTRDGARWRLPAHGVLAAAG